MSLSATGFNMLSSVYVNSVAIAGTTALTYLAARFIPALKLPPMESAKFAAIYSLVSGLGEAFIKGMYNEREDVFLKASSSRPKVNLNQVLARWTFRCLLVYGIYAYATPVSLSQSFIKTYLVAHGALIATNFIIK